MQKLTFVIYYNIIKVYFNPLINTMLDNKTTIETVQAEWMGETTEADKQERTVIRENCCCFD